MKSRLIAAALFTFTAAAIACYPTIREAGAHYVAQAQPLAQIPALPPGNQARPQVEVVFALDTTGSMGGLIQAAKEKIWSIATTMSQAQPAPEIRMGLVAYRDRGDVYVTRVIDLSDDLDSIYAALMDFSAGGGGDGPESVNQALYDAVHKISWGQQRDTYRVVFLVGDSPPHMDYQDDVKYPQTLAAATNKGIIVNTIQAGGNVETQVVWHKIAQGGQGQYAQVSQTGDAVAIRTPFDKKLAALSKKLDDTRLYYGSKEVREKKQEKIVATNKMHASASVESRARRAAFNASHSGKSNLIGDSELIDGIASGRVELGAIEQDQLPEPLQAMAPEERQVRINELAGERKALQEEIKELAAQRKNFLLKKAKESSKTDSSLDRKLYHTIREQAAHAGIRYEAEEPAY
jgi:Mg-chelatase subunit ChlD